MIKKGLLTSCILTGMFLGANANAQDCSAEVEEASRAAVALFPFGAPIAELLHEEYAQHNPAFIKRAREAGMTDYDYAVQVFGNMAAGRGAGNGGPPGGMPAGPEPIVMVDCDLVTTIRGMPVQDPNEAEGVMYIRWGFDTFRVQDGRLIEHWDAATIQPE